MLSLKPCKTEKVIIRIAVPNAIPILAIRITVAENPISVLYCNRRATNSGKFKGTAGCLKQIYTCNNTKNTVHGLL